MNNIESSVSHNEEMNKGLDLKQEIKIDVEQMPVVEEDPKVVGIENNLVNDRGLNEAIAADDSHQKDLEESKAIKEKKGFKEKVKEFTRKVYKKALPKVTAGILAPIIAFSAAGCAANGYDEIEYPTAPYVSDSGLENTDDTITLEIRKPDLSVYDSELTEAKPELKEFCSKLLYAYDESGCFVLSGSYNPEDTKFQNFIDRETILKYAKTGEGIDTINFEDGTPAFCMINMSEIYEDRMREAVNQWLEVCPNFLDSITENGMCIFFDNKYDPGYGHSASYNEYGVLICNMDDSDLGTLDVSGDGSMEDNGLVIMMRRYLAVEPFGMRTNNLGGDFLDDAYEPVIKQALAWYCLAYLARTTNDAFCMRNGNGEEKGMEFYLDMCENPEKVIALINKIMDENLVTPFGADNWQEIEEVIGDVIEDSNAIINQ